MVSECSQCHEDIEDCRCGDQEETPNKPLYLKPCRSCPPETKQNCWQRCLKYYQWIKWRKEGTPITQINSDKVIATCVQKGES